jgi:small neutral amino acid transporter SnatA (MarC family)
MPVSVENDFWVLRALSYLARAVGVLLIIIGFFLLTNTLNHAWDDRTSWTETIGAFAGALATYTAGELILLFLKIERNTRRDSHKELP